MDVPFNKSGASSRSHYQIVRNVENAPERAEELLLQEVERIRTRIAGKMVSTAELRKDLIVLLYCLNSSADSVRPVSLAFALPSAVHLAEAGMKTSEKHVGYLFCSEVMARGHELELMLVNTVRKDLTSSSNARMALALEYLISSPSIDIVPAVQTRCVELLSHSSVRIKILAMHALCSLSRHSTELLHDEKVKRLVFKRISDGDESVVRAALRMCLSMVEDGLLEKRKLALTTISLIHRFSDKHAPEQYSQSFKVAVLNALANLFVKEEVLLMSGYAKELLPSLFSILRRAVKHNYQPIILECFRLLGRFPTSVTFRYIHGLISPQSTSIKIRPQLDHPVALIRHFLSSRSLNELFLFLSCLACLDPVLWAGTQATEALLTDEQEHVDNVESRMLTIPPVLDQLEVERVLSSLESDDAGVRALTIRILIPLEPSLITGCYERTLATLRNSSSTSISGDRTGKSDIRGVARATQLALELALAISLGKETNEDRNASGQLFAQKLKEITDTFGETGGVNGGIVEIVLSRVRKEDGPAQLVCILGLFSLFEPEGPQEMEVSKPVNSTLLLIFLALSCELAPALSSRLPEVCKVVDRLATMLNSYTVAMQEPMLLTMARLTVLLVSVELRPPEVESASQIVCRLRDATTSDKKQALLLKRRCEQFIDVVDNSQMICGLMGGKDNLPLPEFALLLDQGAELVLPVQEEFSPPPSKTLPSFTDPAASLSQSKLRYDAYAPPSINSLGRFGRNHGHGASSATSEQSSIRSPSRASDIAPSDPNVIADLTRTVTAGELTLAMRSGMSLDGMSPREGRRIRESEKVSVITTRSDAPAKPAVPLVTLDSPFASEPLVDVADRPGTPSASSPYVSASASLRTTPEPEPSFEEMWSVLTVNENAFSARGWCDDPMDVAVRRLQSIGLWMDVVPADVPPFEGDLKILLRTLPSERHNSQIPSALLRLHEEGDGSCLWQVRCIDAELGSKVKGLLR
ncbi:hypothetical protein M0805_008279 [Coniferiporia weirii]|nr:hypothetical protein M0805_008279 [Coniferiporia weirii]